ncbi:MAG: hypothetical protein WC364_04735 [Eubacteriales bacterium]
MAGETGFMDKNEMRKMIENQIKFLDSIRGEASSEAVPDLIYAEISLFELLEKLDAIVCSLG